MVAFDASTSGRASAGERMLGLAALAADWVGGVWRAARNRRSIASLLEWDERMLRDIGLTRGDVCAVMALPARHDPSARLSELSLERRAAVRARAREHITFAAWRQPPRRSGAPASKSCPVLDL